MTDHTERELAVFSEARRLTISQRSAFLDRACAGALALRRRVEELLKASDEAGNFLERLVAVPSERTVPVAPAEKSGDRIGRYKLLQQIGEGGCGVVYMAEQEEPVRRRAIEAVLSLEPSSTTMISCGSPRDFAPPANGGNTSANPGFLIVCWDNE